MINNKKKIKMLKALTTIAAVAYAVDIEATKAETLTVSSLQIATIAAGYAVSASTTWAPDHGADRARLGFETDYGSNSWCARVNDVNQWFQVNFGGHKELVTEVKIQGRSGAWPQWVTSYKLGCSQDGESWEWTGPFEGVKDQVTIVSNKLKEPMWCRFVRINPQAWNQHISMRAEVYIAAI